MAGHLKNILSSEGVKQASLVTVGNISATMIAAIAMIIFSRVLGPADFGVFSALFSILLILSKVGDLGINIAAQRYIAGHTDDKVSSQRISQTSSALKLYLSLGIAIIGIISGDIIATNLLHVPSVGNLVRLVFILSGFVVFYEYVTSLLQAKQQFGHSVIVNWIQSTGKLVVGGIMAYFGLLTTGSVMAIYLLVPLIAGWYGVAKLPLGYLIPKIDQTTFKTLISVTKWTSISIIAASLADNIDIVIVQNLLSSHVTGLWSSAVRIASLASLIGWSLGSVLSIRVAKYQDKENLDKYLKKAILLAALTFCATLLLIPFSSFLINITVGADYIAAAPYLNLLLISTAILTATSPFTALFYLFDAPQYFAYSGIISAVVLVGLDLLLIPSLGPMGAGYARVIMRVIIIIFTLLYARRAYRYRYGK